VVKKVEPPRELLEEWEREDEEARRIRRERADWKFIEEQPPRIRAALLLYVETGDPYKAARIAGMSLGEFDEVRRRAGIPAIT